MENVDKREADAISNILFTIFMTWEVQESNAFVWAFAFLMWHQR